MICREFTKSKEGIEQFERLGLVYEDNLQDELYSNWLNETTNNNLEEFAPGTPEKQITTLHVKQVSTGEYTDEGKPLYEYYVVYDISHTRIDKAGNPVTRYLPNQGMYPIPRVRYKLGPMEFGKAKREIDFIAHLDTGYTTKWTKANLLKLIKEIPLKKGEGGASVGIITATRLRFNVGRFDDLLNKTWDQLLGEDTTDEVMSKIVRKRNEQISGTRERPLTASDVEAMLESKSQKT